MASIDLRASLNAISDVIINRPQPQRQYDQIYMKAADMLLHLEHVSHHFRDREVLFVGDGDAIGLCLIHLFQLELLRQGPARVHVVDFDPRVVRSVQMFATKFHLTGLITAEIYNVKNPLPSEHWQRYEAFHINPPFGSSNGGRSVSAFMRRGMEALSEDGVGCIVIADHSVHPWAADVLLNTQREAISNGFMVAELVPRFHRYHLDGDPDLTSCSMVIQKTGALKGAYASLPLSPECLVDFYGKGQPLDVEVAPESQNS